MGSVVSQTHIVLLGDSTIDNRFYVGEGNSSVIDQLRTEAEKRSWKASSFAVDGHSIGHIQQQLTKIPEDTTHLFISIGGNDVLPTMSKLHDSVKNVQEALSILRELQEKFEKEYVEMLDHLKNFQIPLTLCTIYNPNFGFAEQQKICETGLSIFNDVIFRESIKRGIPLIDFRTIFNDPKDYANHIEPDVQGGAKIVKNIVHVVEEHSFDKNLCSVYSK